MTTRSDILNTAEELINGDRQKDYGPPNVNFQRIADYWNVYLKHVPSGKLDTYDVAALMALLKMARLHQSPTHFDSYVDFAGYIGLAGELANAKKATPSAG